MQIGLFELDEPLPVLRSPHLLTILHPWVDAGSVGTLSLDLLEKHFQAKPLGRLTKPGHFFDLTRYRPTVHFRGNERVYTVPTTTLSYASLEGHDLLFMRLLEPHQEAEEYIDNLVALLKHLNVVRVCRVSSMWDAVPHTRPLPSSHSVRTPGSPPPRTQGRRYEGPTSIMNVFFERTEQAGAEQATVMVRLPYYAQLEEDHAGAARALESLAELYPIPTNLVSQAKLRRQRRDLDAEVRNKPGVEALVHQLEADYDSQQAQQTSANPPHPEQTPPGEPETALSPEVEKFLRELGEQFGR